MSKTDVQQIVQETVKKFEVLCTEFVQQTEAVTRQQVMNQLPELLGQVQQKLGTAPMSPVKKTNGKTKAAVKAVNGTAPVKVKRKLSPEGKAALAANLKKARAAKAAKEEAAKLAVAKAEKANRKASKKRSDAQKKAWETRRANKAKTENTSKKK